METMTSMEGILKQFAMIRKAYGKCLCQIFQEENFSPSEIDALIFLSNNPSINTSKELCFYLGISKSLVCRSVEALLKRGLLEIMEDEKDRRIQRLHLTISADRFVLKIKEQQTLFSKTILQDIDREKLETVYEVMQQINHNVAYVLKGEVKNENV